MTTESPLPFLKRSTLITAGWHVPSNDEFIEQREFIGGANLAGGKFKEIGTEHWNENNASSNESGFGAVGAGISELGNPQY